MKTKLPASKNSFIKKLGPGLITGASDDDPSGIATYSQAGAQLGYGMLWTMLLTYPLMTGIQAISARIGRVTGRGISGNILHYYGKWPASIVVVLLLVANMINLGANIKVMGEAVKLIMGGPASAYAALLAVVSILLQIFVPYTRYVSILKWLTLTLFAYVATILVVNISWGEALRHTLWPEFQLNREFITLLIAVLGTTISPYLFFWQASQEVEEEEDDPEQKPLKQAPEQAKEQLERIKIDTYVGMAFSNLVAFFIMLATAATLHKNGIFQIESAAQAAEALRPIAGRFAFLLFALGIVGTGLLSLPVLAGSSAYALSEAFGWSFGLEKKFGDAKPFYIAIAASVLLGLALNFLPINPIRALVASAMINGIIAVPVMILMMLMATHAKVMGEFVLSFRLKILGWCATGVMLAAAIGLCMTL